MSGIRIIGLGKALPSRIVTNDDLSRVVETSDEWIRTRTGIRERRIARENLPKPLRTEHGPEDDMENPETCTALAAGAARQALQDAGAEVITAQSTADTAKQKLQIMLGWKADASPEIGDVPALDMARIDAMNPSADLPQALENNYTLRMNKKKLQNATNETDVKTLQSTIADNEARIAASLQSQYLNVISARNTFLYQQSSAALTRQTADQTAQRYALGTASLLDHETAQIGAEQAEISLKQAEYALLQAINNYEWAVKGLAAASAG